MDLIPKPDQVVSAASNVAHKLLYGGLADLRPMPRTLVSDGTLRELYHYRPAGRSTTEGDPVLLVTPLAAPSLCFDLRRGCSLVEHLVQAGRPTYLVEYGQVSFRDRNLGMEHWIDEVVPTAIRETSEHCGGRPVHLVGWSLGGIFALLTAADQPDLPIASVTAVGTPFDVKQVPLVAPLRPLLNLTDGRGAITRTYQTLGGAPKPLVRWAFQLSSFQKLVTKPLAIATRLDDTDFLAQLEAVDRFTDNMIAYPGRTFGQLYHRFVKGNQLVHGTFALGDRIISMANLRQPVLVFAGATDGIAPVPAVRALLPLLSGAQEVRFEIVPGGHLGMLTGRASRGTTWRVMDEWFDQWQSPQAAPATARRTPRTTRKTAPKTAAPKAAPKKPKPAGKSAPKKPKPSGKAAPKKPKPAGKSAPQKPTEAAEPTRAEGAEPAIGVNPQRRYGSRGSRALAP
ncbi:MAG TPA: alpha/beta fold hydrolase [Nocardioides sp.]|uniref:alpha/beta fold hydrolase n=1 Tax=Nocardioides sp. TaxID=35761 RepID=UPI002B8508F0|nr:alpha/beta fold hydrolase [Nocardioides sp.]HQR26989.1 alpha/beta fold hydrolase [Nocardioides sp.]